MNDEEYGGFGLARLKYEGAPVHPEDLDWEHYLGEGCSKCDAKWKRQLEAWEKWHEQRRKL